MRNTTSIFAIGLYLTIASGRAHSDDRSQFEVASVKLSTQCVFDTSLNRGGVALKGVTLKLILAEAFKISSDRINAPSWVENVCFDIFAKLPQGGTTDQIPIMLQSLLADRFKLTAHKENRDATTYGLVIDKRGVKMKQSTESSNFMRGRDPGVLSVGRNGTGIKGAMTMDMLARTLSRALSRQGYGEVVDATGLDGKYEIELSWAPAQPLGSGTTATSEGIVGVGQPSTPAVDLFSAVRESLGLRLEPRRTSADILIVDHIERVPTEN